MKDKNKITLDFESDEEQMPKKRLPKSFRVEKDEEEKLDDFEDESDLGEYDSQEVLNQENEGVFTSKKISTSSLDSIQNKSPKKTKPKMSMGCDLIDKKDSGKTPIYEDKVSSDTFKIKELELKIIEKQIELQKLKSTENLPIPSNNFDNSVKSSEEKVEQGSVSKTPSFISDPVLPESFPIKKEKIYFIRFWKNWGSNQDKPKVSIIHTSPLVSPDDNIVEKNEIPLKFETHEIPKRCPLCDSKIVKSASKQEGNLIYQKIKCKSPDCDFHKSIEFKI